MTDGNTVAGARRRRLRRGIVILPSAFTVGNMFLGVWAIIHASRGDFATGQGALHRSNSASQITEAVFFVSANEIAGRSVHHHDFPVRVDEDHAFFKRFKGTAQPFNFTFPLAQRFAQALSARFKQSFFIACSADPPSTGRAAYTAEYSV